MLSQFQRQVAEIIAGLEEATDFALAGGAALIVRGEVERQTRDLDFFGLTPAAVDHLVPAVESALRDAGFSVNRIHDRPGFARLVVVGGGDRTEVDLAADARLFPVELGEPAPTLQALELAVDKVLALFGRAEARDFVDLLALEPRYGLGRLCELAAEKDRGFSPAVFAEMLGRFNRLRRDEFEIDDEQYNRLITEIKRWQAIALDFGKTTPHRPERQRDDDLGFGL